MISRTIAAAAGSGGSCNSSHSTSLMSLMWTSIFGN